MIDMNIWKLHLTLSRYFITLLPYLSASPSVIQDLKDRYYSVCRKLVQNRAWTGDEASKAQLISSFQFDQGINQQTLNSSLLTPIDRTRINKEKIST